MERQQRSRSRSLQPRVGQSPMLPVANLTVETKPSLEAENFVLPQYIASQYNDESGNLSRQKSNVCCQDESAAPSRGVCQHVECMPHGIFWTSLGIFLSWTGLGLAFFSRQSLRFVSLERPWHIASMYNDISALGVIHAGICYNETVSTLDDASKAGCFKVALATNTDLDDPIFKLAAVFVSLSVLMGCILTFAMTTTVIWKTINFRAIGTGYMFVYCFQSLAFLFFDTDICESHKCKLDIGCVYCIAASVCWISSCLLCAKMESNRVRSDLSKERKRRKAAAAKEAMVRQPAVRKSGPGTVVTERTMSTVSDEITLEYDKDEEHGFPVADKSTRQRPPRHRSLSRSRSKEPLRNSRAPRKQSLERPTSQHRSNAYVRLNFPTDTSRTPRRQSLSSSGIARQHESIITLNPTGRPYTGQTIHSVPSPTSLEDTLDNQYGGQGAYQGKVIEPNRGRSRSKRRTRGRSKSSSPRAHEKDSQQPKTTRGRSKSDRGRACSKSRSKGTGPVNSPRTYLMDFEEQVQIATKEAQRQRHAHSQTDDLDTSSNVSISPLTIQSSSRPTDLAYVTSYFDI